MKLDCFATRADASTAACEMLAKSLKNALQRRTRAMLVVSGGSTPADCFEQLSRTALPWQNVDVTLTDERCVPPDHEDSNERMLRATLFREAASQANFVPLPEVHHDPFDAVLVGMGADGHFASLFPDAANLDQGLNLATQETILEVSTSASTHRRISMTLARLLRTQTLLLLCFGSDKRAILENPQGLPVSHLLNQQQTPLQVLWAA